MGARPAPAVDGRGATAVPIGDLGTPGRAAVDAAGRITPHGRGWSLAWRVGAEDRWRRPGDEPSTRQTLLERTPVVQTVLRVPGGDVASRAYAVGGAAVMEIENLSPVPVAVAFCIEPEGAGAGPAAPGVRQIRLEGDRVLADGVTALLLPRPPSGTAWAVAGEPDVTRLETGDGSVRDRGRRAGAAFVFPLPHGASIRVRVPLGAPSPPEVSPSPPAVSLSTPVARAVDVSAVAAARSWVAHRRRGAGFALPPGPLADALDAAVCFALLAGDQADIADAALVVDALDRSGFGDEAAVVLRGWFARQRDDGSFGGLHPHRTTGAALAAFATHVRMTADAELLPAALPVVALGVGALRRLPRRADTDDLHKAVEGLDAAAGMLRERGHPAIATRAEAHASAARVALRGRERAPGDEGYVVPEPGLMPWDDPVAVAGFVSRVCRMLVRSGDGSELILCSALPAAWEGQDWDVREAPTELGLVSFAVRWHGHRPALLWDVAARTGHAPRRIVAPGLDPAWSTVEARGEALLRTGNVS